MFPYLDYFLDCILCCFGIICAPPPTQGLMGVRKRSCLLWDTCGFVHISDVEPFKESRCITTRFIPIGSLMRGTRPSTEQFAVETYYPNTFNIILFKKGSFGYLLLYKLKIYFKNFISIKQVFLLCPLCVRRC